MSVNSYWGTEDSEILLLGQAIVWSFISLIFFLWCPGFYIFVLNLEMLDLYLFTFFSISGLKQGFSTLTTYRSQLENTDARAAFDANCIRIWQGPGICILK